MTALPLHRARSAHDVTATDLSRLLETIVTVDDVEEARELAELRALGRQDNGMPFPMQETSKTDTITLLTRKKGAFAGVAVREDEVVPVVPFVIAEYAFVVTSSVRRGVLLLVCCGKNSPLVTASVGV